MAKPGLARCLSLPRRAGRSGCLHRLGGTTPFRYSFAPAHRGATSQRRLIFGRALFAVAPRSIAPLRPGGWAVCSEAELYRVLTSPRGSLAVPEREKALYCFGASEATIFSHRGSLRDGSQTGGSFTCL